MDKVTLAYCAGVVDSDGCITIKKRRVFGKMGPGLDSKTYSPSIFVRQVEPGAVELLLKIFAGSIRVHGPSTPGGRDLNQWEVSHHAAVRTAKLLLPFLRIKHEQAKILIEYQSFMERLEVRRHPYWFAWTKNEAVYTVKEATQLKGLSLCSVWQMLSNKTIPARREGRRVFIPARFWDSYQVSRKGRSPLPPGYMAWREEICQRIRNLNGPTRGVKTADRRK